MKETSQLASSCVHCGHLIEYAPESAGKVIECPACKRKSQLPPAPAAKSPQPVPASQAGSKGKEASGKSPVGGHRHVFVWLAAVFFGGVVVLLTATQRLPITARAAEAPPPPAVLPPPKVKTAKSLNDLKIGSFTLQQRSAGDARMDDKRGAARMVDRRDTYPPTLVVTGDIVNQSENVHRGVKVQLELLDAQGLTRVGTLDSSITELRPHATWHVLASSSNPRAKAVRVIGIKEEP